MPKSSRKCRTHGKDENIFKFSSFSDQINSITVSSIQRAHRVVADDDGIEDPYSEESFLGAGIDGHLIETQTMHFQSVVRQLRSFVGSYSEVVFHQKEIFAKLESSIADADDASLIGIMRLLIDFCKDLQTDFYQYFFKLLSSSGLRLKAVASMKALFAVFSCLTTCIKIIMSCFKMEDVEVLLASLAPLMESKRPAQVKFAAGAFAFISKKLIESDVLVEMLYSKVTLKSAEGFQLVLYEICKGVGVDFSFRFPSILSSLVLSFPDEETSTPAQGKLLDISIEGFLEMISKNEEKRAESVLFFWDSIKKVMTDSKAEYSAVYRVLSQIVSFQNGKIVSKYIFDLVISLLVQLKVTFQSEMCLWYNLCSAVVDYYSVNTKSSKDLQTFKEHFFEFDRNSWAQINEIIWKSLGAGVNNVLRNFCLPDVVVLAKTGFSELASCPERSKSLITVIQLVCKTSCLSDKKLLAETFDFIKRYSEASYLTIVEKSGIVFVASRLPASLSWAKTILVQLEQKLPIPPSILPEFLSGNEDDYLWDKITFSYLLFQDKFDYSQFPQLLSRVESDPVDLDTLSALSMFLSVNNQSVKDTEIRNLIQILKANFIAFDCNVVLKTVEVFMNFRWTESTDGALESPVQNILRVMYKISSSPVSFESLREKQVLAEKLSFEIVSKVELSDMERNLIKVQDLAEIAFSFLISVCFQRFVPLQKGLTEVLTTYADAKKISPILDALLVDCFDVSGQKKDFDCSSPLEESENGDDTSLNSVLKENLSTSKRFSVNKKREIVLEMFRFYPQLANLVLDKLKTRFFNFLVRDFTTTNVCTDLGALQRGCNLEANTEGSLQLEEGESHIPTLITFFKVFAPLVGNKGVRKDSRFMAVILSLLKSRVSFIQKAALEFLFAFKLPYIEPYIKELSMLTSEKTVRKGLAELKFSSENCIVNEVHRSDVLKIMTEFLLGRMNNMGWVSNMDERCRIIFQFVRFLQPEEKEMFVKRCFEDFNDLIHAASEKHFDFNHFEVAEISRFLLVFQQVLRNMKKLTFLQTVRSYAKCVFNICISLERSRKTWSSSDEKLSRFKRLFKQSIACLLTYVQLAFDPLEDEEIELICEKLLKPVLVVKSLDDLTNASLSVHFRFVRCFATNPKYQKFLDFKIDARNDRSVLECICQFLQPSSSPELQFFILGILNSLIPESETEDEDIDTLGAFILKRHARFVIKFLQQKMLSDSFKSLKLTQRAQLLQLLMFLVSDITSPQECLALAKTLADYISKKRKGLPIEMSAEITRLIVALLKRCECPASVLFTLSSNFSETLPHELRNDLCEVYSIIDEKLSKVLLGLNAWNPRYLEEPDFPVRFESFSKIPEVLKGLSPENCVIALAVLFKNCCYFIQTVEDFAIRDRSVETMRYFMGNFDLNQKLINLMKYHICTMLKAKPEDAILINIMNTLKCFVETCHDKDSNLQELKQLQTAKIDYLDDLTQLQVSRRCRGLLKVAKMVSEDLFSFSTCSTFIIPLAWVTIVKFEDGKDPNLITACIEVLKSCAVKMDVSDLIKLCEQSLSMVNRNQENPRVACRVFSAVLSAFGSNDWIKSKLKDVRSAEKIYSLMNSFAGKTLSMLMNQKMSDSDIIDKDESNAIIAKLPVHIGLFYIAKHLQDRKKDFHIKKMLLSICGFLRSRDKSVRHATRGVLLQILPNLEKYYLNELIKDLFHLLDRGYLRHILVFTLFRVFTEAKSSFTSGDFEPWNLKKVSQFLAREIFGLGAEERTSAKLISKTEEARKGYAIPAFGLLGFYCSDEDLKELLKPLSEALEEKETTSNKNTVNDILIKFGSEILQNKRLKTLEILKFVQEVCSGNLKNMFVKSSGASSKEKRDPRLRPEDYRLLEPVPIRAVDRKANVVSFSYHHVFLQFGFQLLLKLTAKLDKNTLTNSEILSILQEMLPIVMKSTNSSYLPVLVQAVRCLKEFFSLSLENVVTSENFDRLILISKKFCRGGAVSSDIQELIPVVSNCTKLFLTSEKLKISNDQLAIVLAHIEEDLDDKNKVKPSLSLLKAVIGRRLKHENVQEVVKKVSEIMIKSPISANRINCRNLYLEYLIGYAQDKTEKSLDFVLAQVANYEEQTGRESAIELLILFAAKVNQKFLNKVCLKMFYPLCLVLGKDQIQSCRKLARLCLDKIFLRVGDEEYLEFAKVSRSWMENYDDLSLTKLGFVVAEIVLSNCRNVLVDKFPLFLFLSNEALNQFDLTKGSFISKAASNSDKLDVKMLDYAVCAVFKLIDRVLKLLGLSSGILESFRSILPHLVHKIADYIVYPHEWVQVSCCEILSTIFSKFQPSEFLQSEFVRYSFKQNKGNSNEIITDYFVKLIDGLFNNVVYFDVSKELVDLTMKLVVYLVLVFSNHFLNNSAIGKELLPKLIDKLNGLAFKESKFNHKSVAKRQFVFSCFQLVLQSFDFVQCCQRLDEETLDKLLVPVIRELISKSSDEKTEFSDLYQKTYQSFEKAFRKLRTESGEEFLPHHYTKIVANLRAKKLERVVTKKREAVLDPESYAAKKTAKHAKQRVDKKRKIAESRGKIAKKKKLGDCRGNPGEMLVEDLG